MHELNNRRIKWEIGRSFLICGLGKESGRNWGRKIKTFRMRISNTHLGVLENGENRRQESKTQFFFLRIIKIRMYSLIKQKRTKYFHFPACAKTSKICSLNNYTSISQV